MSSSSPSTLLDKLNTINETNTLSVSIPSLSKPVSITGLNVKQQKDIIKTVADGASSGITLTTAINDMILNNVQGDVELSIIDRYPIVLNQRNKFVSNVIKLENGAEIDLVDHIAKCDEGVKTLKTKKSFKTKAGSIVVNVEIPTLKRDSEINSKAPKSADDNVKETIGDLYVSEIVKFISTIVDTDAGDEDAVYDFKTLGYNTCKRIVEALPSTINQKIIDIIGEVREIENYYLQTEEGTIEITPAFFSVDA